MRSKASPSEENRFHLKELDLQNDTLISKLELKNVEYLSSMKHVINLQPHFLTIAFVVLIGVLSAALSLDTFEKIIHGGIAHSEITLSILILFIGLFAVVLLFLSLPRKLKLFELVEKIAHFKEELLDTKSIIHKYYNSTITVSPQTYENLHIFQDTLYHIRLYSISYDLEKMFASRFFNFIMRNTSVLKDNVQKDRNTIEMTIGDYITYLSKDEDHAPHSELNTLMKNILTDIMKSTDFEGLFDEASLPSDIEKSGV